MTDPVRVRITTKHAHAISGEQLHDAPSDRTGTDHT